MKGATASTRLLTESVTAQFGVGPADDDDSGDPFSAALAVRRKPATR